VFSHYAVFIGTPALVHQEDEFQFLALYLLNDSTVEGMYAQLYELLRVLGERIAFLDLLVVAQEGRVWAST
jgi:hypothetical protein